MEHLPSEVWQRIWQQLTPATILTLQGVCRRWQQLIRAEEFIRQVVLLHNPQGKVAGWSGFRDMCFFQPLATQLGRYDVPPVAIPYVAYWVTVVERLVCQNNFQAFLEGLTTQNREELARVVIRESDSEEGDDGNYAREPAAALLALSAGHLHLWCKWGPEEPADNCEEGDYLREWLSTGADGNPWRLTTFLDKEASLRAYAPHYLHYQQQVALPVVVTVGHSQAVHYLTYQQTLGVAFFFYLYGQGTLALRLQQADGQLLAPDSPLPTIFLSALGRPCYPAVSRYPNMAIEHYRLDTNVPATPHAYFTCLTFMQGFITAARWWGVHYRRYYVRLHAYHPFGPLSDMGRPDYWLAE